MTDNSNSSTVVPAGRAAGSREAREIAAASAFPASSAAAAPVITVVEPEAFAPLGPLGEWLFAEGAALRDLDGRTYAGAPVALTSLALTGLQVAVATALSSGAEGFEAAVLVGSADGADAGAQQDDGVVDAEVVDEDPKDAK